MLRCAAVTRRFLVCRFAELQVYELMSNTAVSLVEVAREAAPVYEDIVAFIYSAMGMQRAGHPRLMSVHLSCLGVVVWCTGAEMLYAHAGCPCGMWVRTRFVVSRELDLTRKLHEGCCRACRTCSLRSVIPDTWTQYWRQAGHHLRCTLA